MADGPILPTRIDTGTHPEQFVDHYRPELETPVGTVVSLHGGYWRIRYGLDINTAICHHLVRRGWEVVNIEYRRIVDDDAPSVWPDMTTDVLAGVAWAAGLQGAGTSRPLIAVGHSAGGHLALWAGAQPHSPITAVVALAPVADLVASDRQHLSTSATRALLGGSADAIPDVYASASPRALLPLGVPQLVVHGEADDAVPADMSTDYVAAAMDAGDDAVLLSPDDADHFTIIDPRTAPWRDIDTWMDSQRPV